MKRDDASIFSRKTADPFIEQTFSTVNTSSRLDWTEDRQHHLLSFISHHMDVEKYSGKQRNAFLVCCYWLRTIIHDKHYEVSVVTIVADYFGKLFVRSSHSHQLSSHPTTHAHSTHKNRHSISIPQTIGQS